MGTVDRLEPIPHPPSHLFVGNLFDLDASSPIDSLMDLARKYGPIYELELPGGGSRVIVSGYDLVDELCNESRFDKKLGQGLSALAEGPADRGLFTSETSDPNWRKAHNVLLPAFSMDAMRGYHPRMLDIAFQLMQKWERLNPDDSVDVPADMTRLTLDTIALCGFNYRFNSLYRDAPPLLSPCRATSRRRSGRSSVSFPSGLGGLRPTSSSCWGRCSTSSRIGARLVPRAPSTICSTEC